jgi:hypothetical protein
MCYTGFYKFKLHIYINHSMWKIRLPYATNIKTHYWQYSDIFIHAIFVVVCLHGDCSYFLYCFSCFEIKPMKTYDTLYIILYKLCTSISVNLRGTCKNRIIYANLCSDAYAPIFYQNIRLDSLNSNEINQSILKVHPLISFW